MCVFFIMKYDYVIVVVLEIFYNVFYIEIINYKN